LSPHEGGRALAGDIVGRSLTALHAMGISCGVLYLLLGWRPMRKFPSALVLAMVVLTCISQFVITPKIHAIRAGAPTEILAPQDPRKLEFDALHRLSTATESIVLLFGVGVLVLDARATARHISI
jgi:MFS superfamily sulfate permease-like transporter